jgi:signal transduction histidine kinase/ligand-binding sensor domain-containing protein/DNA-binding response OmpR family regulator
MTFSRKRNNFYTWPLMIILALALYCNNVRAQEETPAFSIQKYNITSGLSSDYIRAICQDSEGYIWLASSNGLNRFDGYSSKSYKPDYNKPNTFTNLDFNSLTEDKDGNLWIGTDHSGVFIFNKQTQSVEIIDRSDTTGLAILDNNINHVYCDSRQRVWICTFSGLNMYDIHTGKMSSYSGIAESGKPYPLGTITFTYEDSRGKILIGSWGNGLYTYNEDTDDFNRFILGRPENLNDSINRVNSILEDPDGNYWLGTWEGGLLKTKFEDYKELVVLQHYNMNFGEEYTISSNIIYCLYLDDKDQIWAGTPYGINIISDHNSSKPIISLIQAGSNFTDLGNNDIFDIYEDQSGIIWVATGGGGLNMIDPTLRNIKGYTIPVIEENHENQSIRSFIIDTDSSLLVGVNGLGFGRYDLENESIIPYSQISRFNGLPRNLNAATCFYTDTKNNLWIGSRYSGLFMISARTGLAQQFLNYDPVTGDRSRQINKIYEDHYGSIWIGTNNGLFKLVSESENPTYQLYRYLPDENDPSAIIGEFISAIFEDSDSVLWIGTLGGALNVSKNRQGEHLGMKFEHYIAQTEDLSAIRSNIIYDVIEDRENRIWIGTGTAGIALFDKQNKSFTHFFKQVGVQEDAVFDIIENENELWLSTKNGLIRFSHRAKDDFRIEEFSVGDGLMGNFCIDGAFYKSEKGQIFAGGYSGFNVFYPDELISNPFVPPVVVTNISVADRSVNVYEAMKNGMEIKYSENNINVEFSSLSFSQAEKNKFAYMMKGLDNDWNRTDFRGRKINYTHLPPGNFTLLLKASNNSDTWNEVPLELLIHVKPHPARSWWAILIYGVFLTSVLIIIYRFQINNIKINQAYDIEKLERKKDENINQFKFRFFTNISHELLTPLSVLTFSVENLMESGEKNKDLLKIMERNLRRTMQLISQLLDFRKVESERMTPLVSKGRVDTFLEQICQNINPIADKKNIKVSLIGNYNEKIYFDPDKLDKIFSNLMSNALKYTPNSGQIIIEYKIYKKEGKNWLQTDVTDSGKGIDPEMQGQVFERFYQVKSVTGKTFGAGIGLALAKNLVETHKGFISVENTEELGARFSVHIPVSLESYSESEILNEEMNYQTVNHIVDHDASLLPVENSGNEEAVNDDRKTILIVEDNSDFRNLVKEHFSYYYNTVEADNGESGYEVCLQNQPDLVITDMMMPRMNGIELCNKIKNNIETSDIIVILLTAKTDEETRYESFLANADSYIAKPINIRTLYTRVESLLEQRARLVSKYSTGINQTIPETGLSALDKELIEGIRSIIEDKLLNTELNVLALSKEVGMSTSNLYRKITRLTGMAPVEFIRFIRLQSAASMILTQAVNISEAAYASGFNDLSYFSKSFKKQFEMSPKAYQKKFNSA